MEFDKIAELLVILIKEIRSSNEAYREVNKLPAPTPLPEDWDGLLKENPDPLKDDLTNDSDDDVEG